MYVSIVIDVSLFYLKEPIKHSPYPDCLETLSKTPRPRVFVDKHLRCNRLIRAARGSKVKKGEEGEDTAPRL